MSKRLVSLAAFAAALACVLPLASASAAPSPWWQVTTGSRPTNMWEPTDSVQEITTEMGEFAGFQGVAVKLEVDSELVGCLGTADFAGTFFCEHFVNGFSPTATAAQLEALLESVYGGNVEVVGGPVGGEPFKVTVPGRHVSPIVLSRPEFPLGSASSKVLQSGGSGRLVVSLMNLGDAPVDGTTVPVEITDELPEGVTATGVEAFAGPHSSGVEKLFGPGGVFGPVECTMESDSLVSCTFEGTLPSYEAIEVEILASLTGAPPAAGAPGMVTVSGGDALNASAVQKVKVSPEPTPFGIENFFAQPEEEGGGLANRAGAHPFQLTTTIQLNAGPFTREGEAVSVQQPAMPRNLRFPLPAGLAGNVAHRPQCTMNAFFSPPDGAVVPINSCPDDSVVGVASVIAVESKLFGLIHEAVPVFNLPPTHGEPARFGFMVHGNPILIETAVDPEDRYRLVASVQNTTELADFLGSTVVMWGTPGDPRHDSSRGWACTYHQESIGRPCERPGNLDETAFLRQPVSCASPLDFGVEVEPWNVPLGSVLDRASFTTDHMVGCNQVPFDPAIAASPTSKLADNPSGFDFRLDMPNAGLLNSSSIAEGQAKKIEVILPAGMTINPSEGDGLVGCSPADYARETADSKPGEGCPEASKIGTVQITTPLLEEEAHGALYVASPHDNPFGSLVALYMVAKIPDRGIVVKQAGKVEANPLTGQLITTFDDLPQLPFSSFDLHFREGGRAPLATPPTCGSYDVVARFTPWSAADPNNPTPGEIVTRTSPFVVERGADGGACPSGSTPPFHPGLKAGTLNNAAGHYSPFNLRLTRSDGEQEFTDFSIKLPPGVVGKLAGIPFCSDAAITAAKARTGTNGGEEELEHPSCPAASQVGRTLVGAGVGADLTYVPGKVYLAGPYHGSPLSVVAITAAKVGPFDLGTVVVREALRINPETAEVFIDATGSDPIPHIIQGIPVHARDIRVYVDRNELVLNPTSCERTSTASTIVGSGLDFGSAADDRPVTVTSPFQAADCANLGFRPRLQLKLRGKTNRGGNPALRAVLRPRRRDANAARISVALPHSEFLDQGHIRTVCTRVQFKAGAGNGAECPKGAIYGHAKVWTPLFDTPLEGPVFLRSSEHPLPDLVLAMHGLVDIDAVGRIDSVKGGIRNTFDFVPDAPVTKVVLSMQGGKKGLLENSTNICRGKHLATVKMEGHNGKLHNFLAPLRPKCSRKHARHR